MSEELKLKTFEEVLNEEREKLALVQDEYGAGTDDHKNPTTKDNKTLTAPQVK